jgi:hypothetical protein
MRFDPDQANGTVSEKSPSPVSAFDASVAKKIAVRPSSVPSLEADQCASGGQRAFSM